MSLDHHDDRFDREGEGRVDGMVRDECRDKVERLEALIEKFKLEAAAFSEGVKLIDPRFIDLWERSTRRKTATHPEAIQGFVERVSDDIADLIDQGEIERQRAIAETGRDD